MQREAQSYPVFSARHSFSFVKESSLFIGYRPGSNLHSDLYPAQPWPCFHTDSRHFFGKPLRHCTLASEGCCLCFCLNVFCLENSDICFLE